MNDGLRTGTIGGTLCSLLFVLPMQDMLRTAILAAIGAAVSFAVSWLLQKLRK